MTVDPAEVAADTGDVRTYQPGDVDGIKLAPVTLLAGEDDPTALAELAPVEGARDEPARELAPVAEPVEGARVQDTSVAVALADAPSLPASSVVLPGSAERNGMGVPVGTIDAPTTTGPAGPSFTTAPGDTPTGPAGSSTVPAFSDSPSTDSPSTDSPSV